MSALTGVFVIAVAICFGQSVRASAPRSRCVARGPSTRKCTTHFERERAQTYFAEITSVQGVNHQRTLEPSAVPVARSDRPRRCLTVNRAHAHPVPACNITGPEAARNTLVRKRSVVQVLGGTLPGDAPIGARGQESAHVDSGGLGAGQAGPGCSAEPR